jgi:hypothetical protein
VRNQALLQERPFEVPVDLGKEEESGRLRADDRCGLRPEGSRRDPPCPLEDFRQNQHRHIATDAIALACDPLELANQGVLQRRIPVIQLQGVGPAGEVRIAAVGEDALQLAVSAVIWVAGECPTHRRWSEFIHAVVRAMWFGTKSMISRSLLLRRLRRRARGRAAEIGVDVGVTHGETRTGDVALLEIRENALVFRQPLGVRGRYAPGSLAGLPDAQKPDQIEPVLSKRFNWSGCRPGLPDGRAAEAQIRRTRVLIWNSAG